MDYDIVVLGGGPGGYVAAIRAAQLGAKVALVEARELGGTCLNRGCIPTKALVESAHVFNLAKHGEEYGVKCAGVELDYARMVKRKDEVIERLRKGIQFLMKKNQIDVIQGRGKLLDANTLEVSAPASKKVTARKFILATGSEPLKLPIFPFDGKTVLTSDDALALTQAPKSVLIVGGGYIGVEWASIFRQVGAKVTVVEMMDQLLPRSDTDLAKELYRLFRKAGVDIHLGTKVDSVQPKDGKAVSSLSNGKQVESDFVLVSIGRGLNTKDIGLEAVGIKTERGAVVIDEQCRTSVANIYAIGDMTAKLMLAHVASRQGIVAAESAMGHPAKMDYRVVPACVFTEFEIGSVGLSTAECAAAKIEVKEAKFSFMALGKAQALGETYGWAKIIANAKTGEVVGVHIIGPQASVIIAEAGLAMSMEATVESIAHAIHSHPTLSEAVSECAESWLGRAVHG